MFFILLWYKSGYGYTLKNDYNDNLTLRAREWRCKYHYSITVHIKKTNLASY